MRRLKRGKVKGLPFVLKRDPLGANLFSPAGGSCGQMMTGGVPLGYKTDSKESVSCPSILSL